ncbi:MAG: hypothetical protein H0X66_03265 [Verrucomicrobia bacterium]|nr:hypothetical protein [Verrucomicrobiota bacterium]
MITAESVFREHLGNALSDYGGHLYMFVEALRAGDIPDEQHARVPGLIEQLKQYLKSHDQPEEDSLLLRYGLIVPGLLNGYVPPITGVFPERGGLYEDKVMEIATLVLRLRGALDLTRLAMPQLSPDSETLLVAAAERVRTPIPDEQWISWHLEIEENEVSLLVAQALQYLDDSSKENKRIGTNVLGALAAFRRDGLGIHASELVQHEEYGHVYRDASSAVAHQLIEQIEKSTVAPGWLLMSLAWTRGEAAREAFVRWRENPPTWATGRFAELETFLRHAGWSLDAQGKRKDLISLQCYRLNTTADKDTSSEVPCRVSSGDTCGHCGGPLAWLFDFSVLPAQLFSGMRSMAPRRVLACLHCASYGGTVYSKYSEDGSAVVLPVSGKADFPYQDDRPPCTLYLRKEEWTPFAAAEPFGISNTLGGIPMWVQGAEFPDCPECQKPMPFLAQFDCSSQKPCEEGVYYAFFCGTCRVAAVSYQQT